jgi:hypothetical protein
MSEATSIRPILDALAALAPDRQPTRQLHVSDDDRVVMSIGCVALLNGRLPVAAPSHRIDRILKRAQLHREENLLRAGWLWARTVGDDGQPVQFPLASVAVKPSRVLTAIDLALNSRATGGVRNTPLVAVGDVEVSEAITDPDRRRALEATVELGGGAFDGETAISMSQAYLERFPMLKRWAEDAASAAGLGGVRFLAAAPRDATLLRAGPQVIVELALYLAAPATRSITIASTLRSWPDAGLDRTALGALYRPTDAGSPVAPKPVESPIVLTPAQRDAVASARHAPVTVVSGAPGSGKTQTIAAIALAAVERGESVLVAAPTSAAVDALVDLLGRTPGPEPMVFGADERRAAVADRLANGGGPPVSGNVVERARAAFDTARRGHRSLLASVLQLLDAEQLAGDADPALLYHHRSIAPRWFEPAGELAAAAALLDACEAPMRVLANARRTRRGKKVRAHAGAAPTTGLDQLAAALRLAWASRASAELAATGGLDLDALWPKLAASDDAARAAMAAWLDAELRSEERRGRDARVTMVAVAAALRSGRSARRAKLAAIDGTRLTRALPLWAGTLRDIDDLLPQTAGMFDLVIVDEATQVDQITAAPALLRGRRCVIAGDTRQLRHVSFTSDDAIRTALATAGITDPADAGRLDVRRMSLFDLAAAAAPVRMLDQHFRSAPHLISFSARRFYDGKVTVATTHPRNDDRDYITVEVVQGDRDDGVSRAEIDRAIAIVRDRLAAARTAGTTASVGVLSPFRAQADAIEAAIVEQFSLEEIDELDLRVGTVHGFQGCERDLVIISLGLDAASSPNTRSFVADPNLFNVMVTRARHEIVVVTSLPLDTPGLIGEYLRHGDAPPAVPRSARTVRPEVVAIATDLGSQAIDVAVGYPAGPHVVDLVVGDGDAALGVLFGVHADGPDAHVERHLQLRRAGWELREVFDTRWADRRAELAVELAFGRSPE